MQKTGRKIFLVVTLYSAIGAGCAKVTTMGSPGGTGGNGSGIDGGLFDIRALVDSMVIPDSIGLTCGNRTKELFEGCDDGNKVGDDGCTPLCQIENDWECPTPGQPCVNTARCGDMKLSSSETCDDGNMTGGDGCSADCKTVEAGWVCRVPGRGCSPLCGDGVITGKPPKNETCDDKNTVSGDGCSATCQLEPGATCAVPGQPCTSAMCGNGKVEEGESCDVGMLNGLFFGNATGCSKTCTKEPKCRDGATTRACETSCGNGNIEMTATPPEGCDDGNMKDGDGCSSKCVVEGGFTCTGEPKPDTVPCTQPGNAGQCLELPIIYRDFKNESVAGGHPDFFFLGAPIANPVSITGVQGQPAAVVFNKRYCVPNSSGPAKKNDSVNRCWDMAMPNLDAMGKPVFNAARTGGTNCDCQFIDWSHDTNGGTVPGYVAATNGPTTGLTYVGGAVGHPMYRGPAPIVTSAASFGQWWVDSMYTGGTHTVGTLEMAPVGGQFQFSSQVNSVTGGFFPLDPPGPPPQFPLYAAAGVGPGAIRMVGTEAMLCNLWPYWYPGMVLPAPAMPFGAANGCRGTQYLFPPSLIAPDTALTNPMGKSYPGLQGWFHDSWFTDEARYLFVYNGAFSLQFYGDDDMFIYINGVLVVDMGGVHQRLPGRVDVSALGGMATITEGGSLDAAGAAILPCPSPDPYTMLVMNAAANTDGNGHSNCTTATCDCRTRTVNLALTIGSTYEIAVFGADRHPTESNYQLTLSGLTTNKSNCQPRCGDGVVTGAEECDEGGMNNDTMYGGCTTMCKFGPYCGDGMPNMPQEQCDLGRAMPPPAGNGAGYGANGCSIGCTLPHYCGDANVDTAYGESCDQGVAINGTPGAPCLVNCKIKPVE